MNWQEVSAALAEPFPREVIHWRAQSVTKDGSKALALAYLDARDVMERLDAAAGPENWSDSYTETAKGRLLCTLSIRCNDEWIAKSDGAGETDVEGEKGAISAALKRAAVKWGVGRYLYDMPNVWAPCETFNGKWKAWKGNPWDFVRNTDFALEPFPKVPQHNTETVFETRIAGALSADGLRTVWDAMVSEYGGAEAVPPVLRDRVNKRKKEIREADAQEMTA